MTHRLAVLISGNGTNLQAIIDSIEAGQLPASIAVVLSNKTTAAGLQRAIRAGIATITLNKENYPDRAAFDQAMIAELDQFQPDTIVLAGFMRILSPAFVHHYSGRLINIHPSLLPRHKGLHTHLHAIEAGDTEHGCSVHFVSDELDGGPIIARAQVPVLANDNEETLSNRVQAREYELYPRVLEWRAAGRLTLDPRGVQLDGQPIPADGFDLDQLPAGLTTAPAGPRRS
ncbi:MAG: phosphoribosylglycinamide formyltransferase [Alcanivoracaceae bacterium]|nr:phosphoribosylglycinamide formyltransferase [Alcanivoracaceae bacterium]